MTRKRLRLFVIVAAVSFAALVGLAPAAALWSMPNTVTATVRSADGSGCGRPGLLNGGFEAPAVTNASYSLVTPTSWTVTNAAGQPLVGEVWNTPFTSNYSPQGEQIVEMNSTARGTFSQTITTTPGQMLGWSFYHRGRDGTETVRVSIGASGALVSQGDYSSSNTAGWRVQSGTYTVPAGQTSTTLSIRSTAGGTEGTGNLVDGVAFGVGPCLASSSTVTEVGGTAGSYVVGDRVRYTTTITNSGDAPGIGTGYTFTLPSSLELVAGTLAITDPQKIDATGASVASYDSTTRVISAAIGDRPLNLVPGGRIFPGSSITVTFDAIIQASGAGTTIAYAPTVVTASELAPSWSIPANPADAPITVTAPSADVAATALTTPLYATSGTTTTWTFRATNNGPAAATDVSAALTIPAELTSVQVRYSASNDAVTSPVACTVIATSATCPLGGIPSGQIRRFWVTGTIPANYTATTNPRTMTVNATLTASSVDATPGNNTLAYAATVSTAPTVPANLRTNGSVTSSSVPLAWNASTAVSGIAGYEIWRDGTTKVATTTGTGTTVTITGTPSGSHFFQVRAYDAGGRYSGFSTQVNVTVP